MAVPSICAGHSVLCPLPSNDECKREGARLNKAAATKAKSNPATMAMAAPSIRAGHSVDSTMLTTSAVPLPRLGHRQGQRQRRVSGNGKSTASQQQRQRQADDNGTFMTTTRQRGVDGNGKVNGNGESMARQRQQQGNDNGEATAAVKAATIHLNLNSHLLDGVCDVEFRKPPIGRFAFPGNGGQALHLNLNARIQGFRAAFGCRRRRLRK